MFEEYHENQIKEHELKTRTKMHEYAKVCLS